MLKNYVTIAIRSIQKNKLFAGINIAGLAIGLAIFIFAQLFAEYERSHDAFFPDSERIFAVYTNIKPEANLGTEVLSAVQTRLAPLMVSDMTEIEFAARVMSREYLAATGDRKFYQNVRFADPAFLDIFQFDYIAGDAGRALADPSGLILTESTAEKYFGGDNALGQVITFRNQYDLRVTAVIKDLPRNSHFRSSLIEQPSFEMVASIEALANMSSFEVDGNWDNLSTSDKTYALLPVGGNLATANEQLQNLFETHMPEDDREAFDGFSLRPVTDLNTWIWEAIGIPVITSIQILGLLILVVACLNYVNLATAQIMGRTREVGMRKTLGATKTQLFSQFVTESILLTAFALAIAVALIDLGLPVINDASGKSLSFAYTSSFTIVGWLIAITVGVGLMAGAYPAYLIARGKTVGMLNGETQRGRKGSLLRNIMLVTQFSISIFMMIAVAIIFAQNQKVAESGDIFARDQIVVLDRISRPEIREVSETLRGELARIPGVEGVAFSSQVPFEQNHSSSDYANEPGDEAGAVSLYRIRIDENFMDLYDMPLVAGRGLSLDYAEDTLNTDDEGDETQTVVNVVLNALAAKKLGFETPEEALGQSYHRLDEDSPPLEHRIVGIVPDVNFLGFFNDIKPIIFLKRPRSFRLASVRISGGAIPATLDQIDAVWEQVVPAYPIQRRFLTEVFDDIFILFTGINTALAVFAALALLVAVIGLFGLAAFMTERRTREVGIRKVMGASVARIVRLLVWQFSIPIVIAIFLGGALGFVSTLGYLNFFADRIGIASSIVFVLIAAAVALIVGWGTVSFHALRIARANPIHALRYE